MSEAATEAGAGWDARFDREDYLFGTEPAAFLADHAGFIEPGARALAVADGEGRNAVWLAEQGLSVTAMDASKVALAKARRLAGARGVAVDFRHGDVATWDWQAERYELVVAVFIQFAGPELRARVFDGLKTCLAPGGLLMLHGYTPEQIGHGTGGPGKAENLYTADMLRAAFPEFRAYRLASYEKFLSEGSGHAGRSALIDLIARKP